MTVWLGKHRLRILTDQDASTAPFIQSLRANGTDQTRSWLDLNSLRATNGLRSTLSSTPTAWATTGSPTGAATSTTSLRLSADGQAAGTDTPATATATVSFSDSVAQPGTVEIRNGSQVVARAPLGTGAAASVTIPATTPVGTYQLTATFVPSDPARVTGSTSSKQGFAVT